MPTPAGAPPVVATEDLTPVTSPAETPASDSPQQSFIEDILSDSGEADEFSDFGQEPTPAPEPSVPETPPAPIGDVVAPPAPAPAPEPVPIEPTVTPTPAPEAVQPPVMTPQQQDPVAFAAARDRYITEASAGYQLTEADANNLIANPNAVLPVLAARVEAQVLERATHMVVQILQQVMPTFIDGHLTHKQNVQSGEDEFFGSWKELAPHKARVTEIATVYRTLNPQASKEQFMKDVGVQAWMALGLPIGELSNRLSGTPALPAPPSIKPQTGYSPANPGGGAPPPRSAPDNIFAGFVEEWARELE